MVGMPTRNANSVAAARLLVPNSSATKIAAAEREVPGNTPATTCATPTRIATVQLIRLCSPSPGRAPRREVLGHQHPHAAEDQRPGDRGHGLRQFEAQLLHR